MLYYSIIFTFHRFFSINLKIPYIYIVWCSIMLWI